MNKNLKDKNPWHVNALALWDWGWAFMSICQDSADQASDVIRKGTGNMAWWQRGGKTVQILYSWQPSWKGSYFENFKSYVPNWLAIVWLKGVFWSYRLRAWVVADRLHALLSWYADTLLLWIRILKKCSDQCVTEWWLTRRLLNSRTEARHKTGIS